MQNLVAVRGVRLQVDRRPGPGETVVFVHGLFDNRASWRRVVAGVGPHFDAISYDLRAHGCSDAPISGYSVDDHVGDLLGLLDHLRLESVILVGHSLGADVAARTATKEPARVARLVMVDPPWHLDAIQASEARHKTFIRAWHNLLTQFEGMPLEKAIEFAREANPRWHETDLETWANARLQVRREAVEYLQAPRQKWQTTLSQITCPTLLVIGETRSGSIVHETHAAEASAISPKIQVERIAGAGHAIHRDKFEEFVRVLNRFLHG